MSQGCKAVRPDFFSAFKYSHRRLQSFEPLGKGLFAIFKPPHPSWVLLNASATGVPLFTVREEAYDAVSVAATTRALCCPLRTRHPPTFLARCGDDVFGA